MFKKSISKIEIFLKNSKNDNTDWSMVLGTLIAKEKKMHIKLAIFSSQKKSVLYDKLANRLTFMCKILKY